MQKKEIWKPIPGFKYYEASNMGNIRSVKHIDSRGCWKGGFVLKQWAKPSGRCTVRLWSNGKHHSKYVHRLVMLAFVGICPEGKEVNHIDENPRNNRLDNLEYITHKENMNHGTCTIRRAIKMSMPVEQLSEEGEVIRSFYSICEAARQTGVYQGNIAQCCRNKRHRAGGYKWRYIKENNNGKDD